jgi:hypothetical protein
MAANKRFWGRKLGYLEFNESAANLILFNQSSVGSYHPWNAQVMGEAYGELELHELISIKDYLDSPPSIDNFLHGVAIGKERALKRKKDAQGGKKGKNGYGLDAATAALADEISKGK